VGVDFEPKSETRYKKKFENSQNLTHFFTNSTHSTEVKMGKKTITQQKTKLDIISQTPQIRKKLFKKNIPQTRR